MSSVIVSKRLTATEGAGSQPDPRAPSSPGPRSPSSPDPRPSYSSATMLSAAYRPVVVSATGGPGFAGAPGCPVIEQAPDSAWTSRSYARLWESGPPGP